MDDKLQKPYVASDEETRAIDILVREITKAIQEHGGSYDRTFKSVVTGVSNGKYTIIDEGGASRTVKCSIPGLSIKAGISVWVKIPGGRQNAMHICGIY